MSTNKTQNYGLHSWVPEDDFQLSEINENFAKLDSDSVRIITGTYTGLGDKKTCTVDLGVAPKAVFILANAGPLGYSIHITHGLAIREHPLNSTLILTDTGFSVTSAGYCILNEETIYLFVALY